MPRRRYVPRGQKEGIVTPFQSAEEAWFWFVRCQRAREQGRRFSDGSTLIRPCDPDDIYRIALRLSRRGPLALSHLRVLADFGFMDRPPDARVRSEERQARLWDEALDRLTTVFREKGIVE